MTQTRTGHSCICRLQKTKHGCQNAIEYYCRNTGRIIDPMSCHKGCRNFETVCKAYRRSMKDDEVIL